MTASRARRPADGAPLERWVRWHCALCERCGDATCTAVPAPTLDPPIPLMLEWPCQSMRTRKLAWRGYALHGEGNAVFPKHAEEPAATQCLRCH